MKNITIRTDQPVLPEGSGITHIATSWEVRTKPNISTDSVVLYSSIKDTTDLLVKRIKLNITNQNTLYIRTRYHLSNEDTTPNGEPWSRFVTGRGDQEGFAVSDIVVGTPKVSVDRKPLMDGTENITLTTSAFNMYAGFGDHSATSWLITDSDGSIIFDRPKDITNLLTLSFNSKILAKDKNYVIRVKHHTSTNSESLEGKLPITLHVNENKFYDIQQIGKLIANRALYFKVILYTMMFESIDIIIKDRAGVTVRETLNQKTVTPNIFVGNLKLYETYYVYGRIKLKNGFLTTYKLISTNILEENFLVVPKDGITYLGKHDFVNEAIFKGQTVQCSSEFYNGMIMLSKHDDKSLYRYRMHNDKLVEIGKLLDLPTNNGNLGIPYLNVLPMHNGNFAINYCYDNAGGDEAYSVFNIYDYNASSNRTRLLHSSVNKNELYSTAISSSAIVDKTDTIYYVPALEVDKGGNPSPLALYKIDTVTYKRSKVIDLPFIAKENVSIAITRENEIIIFGGTNFTDIVYSESKVTRIRSNNDIYMFNPITLQIEKLCSLPKLPDTMYNFQSFLRRDGKIVVFNAVMDGISVGDQRTVVIDPIKRTATVVETDMADTIVYRNSMVLRNGDILRMTNMESDPQAVYRYVSDTITLAQVDDDTSIISPIRDLIIGMNEVITIEEPWLYDSITILGTSLEDTGKLRWVQGKETYEYDYTTLIVTRDMTMDSGIFASKGYSEVLVVGNATFVSDYKEIANVLIVPKYTEVTIFDPYQYTKIIIEGTSMEDTGTLIWEDKYKTTSYYYDTLWATRQDVDSADIVNGKEYNNVMILDGAGIDLI